MCYHIQVHPNNIRSCFYVDNFIFWSSGGSANAVCDQNPGLHVFPALFPWRASSHSRQHWSDLLEMNGLITASERRRNTVWRGDGWNRGLGLRKPLRQIEGINDCNTARGPQWPTLFPWHGGGVMASSAALFWHWSSGGSVAAWLTRCSFPHLRDFYEVSKRLQSENHKNHLHRTGNTVPAVNTN